MSILTTEQYLQDADCPELCDNDAFTIIDCKDADYDDDDEVTSYWEDLGNYYHGWDDFEDDWKTHA